MSKKVKKKSKISNNNFKIVILVLSISLLGSLFYIYKVSDHSKNVIVDLRKQNSAYISEKELILKNLRKSQLMLEQTLAGKNSASKALISEKEKVKKLIEDIENSKADQNSIEILKRGADEADARILNLMKQLNQYKSKIDSTNSVLNRERKTIDTLKNANSKLNSKITEVASRLNYYGLNVESYKLKSSGIEAETDKASKVDFIKVMFTVGENSLAKATKKVFYAQIIDSKNNVVGDKKTEVLGQSTLTYSAIKTVDYANKSVKVEFNIPVHNLEKGAYFLNVFDKFKPILNTSFTLK